MCIRDRHIHTAEVHQFPRNSVMKFSEYLQWTHFFAPPCMLVSREIVIRWCDAVHRPTKKIHFCNLVTSRLGLRHAYSLTDVLCVVADNKLPAQTTYLIISAEGGNVFTFVGLLICLFVCIKLTRKVVDRFLWNLGADETGHDGTQGQLLDFGTDPLNLDPGSIFPLC